MSITASSSGSRSCRRHSLFETDTSELIRRGDALFSNDRRAGPCQG